LNSVSKAESFDLVVLGAGPGGYTAAIHAAQVGLKVAIVEKDSRLGGTCLLRGCIPTKALLHSADVYEEAQHSADLGVVVSEVRLAFDKVMERKGKVVAANAKGVEYLMRKNKITVFNGFGRLDGKGRVTVTPEGGETKTLETKNVVVATGSVPRLLPGVEVDGRRIVTSDELLELKEMPKSMLVLGAGAVGVEFASIFKRFGVDVTIVELLPRLVPVEDEEISEALEKAFKKQGIKVATGTKLESIRTTENGVVADAVSDNGGPKQFEAEMLLVAIGRRPLTENIGLEGTAVKLDRGYIQVDEFLRTGEPGVYAIGDVVPTPWLAHVASHEGIVAVDHMAGRHPHPIDYERGVPGVTFCNPEIGSIGLTERQAAEKGYDVKVGRFPWTANGKAKILNRNVGFVKVVTDAKYGEVLGIHIIGPSATELVAAAGIALAHEATAESIFATIHAHPTLSEAVMEAAADAIGLAVSY
jgi:dihydrolipoamide dehydrogenase